MSLIKKIQNTSFIYSLFKEGSRIILAVSGGPDSCVMLDVFSRLQEKYSLELIIAHINYGLRGKDSQKDEKLVRELAERYDLPIVALTPTLSRVQERGQFPSENSLRDLRYDFFEKLRKENKFDAIAVAHNCDDQVETFLMRIIRGAGMQGMSAMKFKNGAIIRPLLATTRKEILEYLRENKLTYRTDKTNLENVYLRNKIRNRFIPYIEKKFNPNIKETISDSVITISQDIAFLDQETEKYCKKFKELDTKKLLKLHPAILRRVLRKKLEEKRGNLKNISAAHIEEIIKIIKSTKNKHQVVILKGLKITRKGDKLEISRKL